jgi:hypothetical protein
MVINKVVTFISQQYQKGTRLYQRTFATIVKAPLWQSGLPRRVYQKSFLIAKHPKYAQSTQRQSIDFKFFANFVFNGF